MKKKLQLWMQRFTDFVTPPDKFKTYMREDMKRKKKYVQSWHQLTQNILSGKTANPKYANLRESLLSTYTVNEQAQFEELMTDFINHHTIASYNLVMEHMPGAMNYDVNTDYLYAEPEIIMFFERAMNNSQALLEVFLDTHYEEAVRSILHDVYISRQRFYYNAKKSQEQKA